MLSARIPLGLLMELQKLYPPRCIAPGESVIEAHRYAAKVELVGLLAEHFNNQQGDPTVIPLGDPDDRDVETGVRTYTDTYADLLGADA